MNKPTCILGATNNPDRYAYKAAHKLVEKGHDIFLWGIKNAEVLGQSISKHPPKENIDTLTLYVGPKNQTAYFDQIVALNPKRVVFNPGTENKDLQELLDKHNIAYIEACTLVMLSNGLY